MPDNQWGTVTLEMRDFLQDVREAVNTIAEFLVSVLDIALASLQLVKSFLVGYVDPILAFVQLIIDYITNLLRDLRSLGIYMCGDWALLKPPFGHIRGGYKAYERRMISRMVDISDPTRPITSADSKVFSIWFYLSVDMTDIERLVLFIRQMLEFFGGGLSDFDTGTLPIPTITKILYATDAATILAPKDLDEFFKPGVKKLPDISVVKWKVEQPSLENPFNPFPPLPPKGYIVSVSTIKEGIPLFFDRPQSNVGMASSSEGSEKKVQPRESGVVVDQAGNPVVLFGGRDQISGFNDFTYNNSLDGSGNTLPGKRRMFGMTSPASQTVIDLENLGADNDHHFQKFFYVSAASTGAQFMLEEYKAVLKLKDMPSDGYIEKDSNGKMKFVKTEDHASEVFVRVAACSKAVADKKTPFNYDLSDKGSQLISTDKAWKLNAPGIGPLDVGPFSDPVALTFPTAHAQEYFDAVRTALIVLALTRPDLKVFDEVKENYDPETVKLVQQKKKLLSEVAAQRSGLENFRHLLGYVFKNNPADMYRTKETIPPNKFREDVYRLANIFVYDTYKATGPRPEVEHEIVQNTKFLRTVTWRELFNLAGVVPTYPNDAVWDTTISEYFSNPKLSTLNCGVAINHHSIGISSDRVNDVLLQISGVHKLRAPQFMEIPKFPNVEFRLPLEFDDKKALEKAKQDYPAWKPVLEQALPVDGDGGDGKWEIPSNYHPFIQKKLEPVSYEGSADDIAPVFYVGKNTLEAGEINPDECGIVYCRGLFAKAKNGQLLDEAYLALNAAASSLVKPPQEGEWVQARFLARFTAIDDVMRALEAWMQAVKETMQSIVDAIKAYIDYLEGRITELQELIKNINDLIMSFFRSLVQIPKASALVLFSDGTDGMLADFVSAKQKPNDSPLSYGAGLGVVMPLPGTALIMEILKTMFNTESDSGSDSMVGLLPPVAIVPNPKSKDEPEEPDVL